MNAAGAGSDNRGPLAHTMQVNEIESAGWAGSSYFCGVGREEEKYGSPLFFKISFTDCWIFKPSIALIKIKSKFKSQDMRQGGGRGSNPLETKDTQVLKYPFAPISDWPKNAVILLSTDNSMRQCAAPDTEVL